MRKAIQLNSILLLVLIFISTNIGLKASHIIGAEISYSQVQGTLYKFNLKVYRDCNECKFDNNGGGTTGSNCPEVPNLKVKGALNTFYSGYDFGEVVMKRVRIEDKTPTCYSASSKCRPNSTVNYGFELQEFEGEYNFSGALLSGKCEFDISIAMSSRNPALNSTLTEQNFFNYAYLNLCKGISNNSTVFEQSPVFVLLQNQTHSLALGVINNDNDSLSFKSKPALLNRNAGLSYSIGRSADQPYGVYCSFGVNCPANPNAPLAEGFYVSETTGDVVFTPVLLNEGGVIVVECEEWKKDASGVRYLAGVTRRDIYAEVITPTNNLPKIKNTELNIDICEGDAFSYQISLEDIKLYSPLSDSVKVNLVSGITGLVLSKNVLNLPPYNFYRIDLKDTKGKNGQYFITINATDNNCPLSGITAKTIVLRILEKRKLEYTYKVKNCGLLQVDNKLKNQNVRWTLCDINNKVLKNQVGSAFTYQLDQGGRYIIKASLDATNNLCAVYITDTLQIDNFRKPDFELGPDQTLCKNSHILLEPKQLITYDAYKIYLDNKVISGFPYAYQAVEDRKFTFKVLQDNGCYAEDIIRINVFPDLKRSFKTDILCSNFAGDYDLDNLLTADRADISEIEFSSANSEVAISKVDMLNSILRINQPKAIKLEIVCIIKDKNGCNTIDTFSLEMVDPKPISIKPANKVCANTASVTLPADLNGVWKCLNYPGNISGNLLSLRPPFSGKIELEYTETNQCVNSRQFTIDILDTTAVTILNGSSLVLCENAVPVELRATPQNGQWEGSFINQNVFYPFSARNTTNVLKYTLTNADGCISADKMAIEVVGLPSFTIESNKSVICVGEELKLMANSVNNMPDGYWFSDGDGRFDHPDKRSTIYIPSVNDIQKGIVNFTYTVQTNTVCGNVSEGIDITIHEAPSGKMLKDYSLSKCEPAAYKFNTDFKNLTRQNWYINDSLVEEFDYEFSCDAVLKAGTYMIKTVVYNGECAATALSEPIEVYSTPASNFIANPSYRLSREYPRLYLKDITKNKNPYTSAWYFNNTLIDNTKEFYYNVDTKEDTFSIKLVNVSSVGGCENSMTRQFIFTPINQLYIPDAFSPDSKGPDENNEFKVKGPAMQFFYIEVFNKWGQMVYFSKDMNAAWDGTYGGKPVIQGVYFYKVNSTDMDGVSRDYSGTVTVIR